MKISIVDYGVGNLLSVQRALERIGASVELISSPELVHAAEKLVLPGVGAFEDGMCALRRLGLDSALVSVAAKGTPLLGLCLGMQLLFKESDEFGIHAGLGLLDGRITSLASTFESGVSKIKVPHIGWTQLLPPPARSEWSGTILAGLEREAVYFVHSFAAQETGRPHALAESLFYGQRFVSAVSFENVHGCQFHPEKSGEVGLSIFKNFVNLPERKVR